MSTFAPMPKIIYGTAWKKERTTSLVVLAVLQGFRGIDTACQPKHYREDLVGEALRILQTDHGLKREELFIQTKYTPIGGQDTSQPLPYDPSTSITSQIAASFARSLQNLGISYIDSYLLHSPLRTSEQNLEAWAALRKLQQEGKVGKIGVSNCYNIDILEMLEIEGQCPVNVVQNRWFEGNNWNWEVVDYCKSKNIQYQSFWTLTGSPSLLSHPSLRALAKRYGCTSAQAVFSLAQQWGIIPLGGSTNQQRMKDGVLASDIHFSAADVEDLRSFMQD